MRFSRDAMARGATALLSCSLVAACHGAAIPAGSAPSEAVQSAAAVGPHKAMLSERAMPFKVVGSGNTVTADMPVPRPDTSPCTVTLFSHLAFENFSPQTFSYTPPSSCPRPWAKVVLNFNVSTSKGVQFDRTAIIWVGGAVAFFGTTAEPSPQLAPRWHTERDVTDLSAIFGSANQGQISLGNCYCPPNYTGILYGTAYLQFYPPDAKYPALPVPDKVIGIPYAPPLGNVAQLPQTTMAIATPL
ncbi:MAG TPA: peptide-N4-asparagine amidase, partial [Candidatus Acidoferrales bacterium]|nr:peptide-N4-asparagine amidase [Candidatus Acidoferrales bacterium]